MDKIKMFAMRSMDPFYGAFVTRLGASGFFDISILGKGSIACLGQELPTSGQIYNPKVYEPEESIIDDLDWGAHCLLLDNPFDCVLIDSTYAGSLIEVMYGGTPRLVYFDSFIPICSRAEGRRASLTRRTMQLEVLARSELAVVSHEKAQQELTKAGVESVLIPEELSDSFLGYLLTDITAKALDRGRVRGW